VVEDRLIIGIHFLLNLESVDVLGEAFNVSRGDGVNQASFANSITTNESVLDSLVKL
jgi:hypothetical protein